MDIEHQSPADVLAEQVLHEQPDLQVAAPDPSPLERAMATISLIRAMKSGTKKEVAEKAENATEAVQQVNEAVGEVVIDPHLVALSFRLRNARRRRVAQLGGRTLTRLY